MEQDIKQLQDQYNRIEEKLDNIITRLIVINNEMARRPFTYGLG